MGKVQLLLVFSIVFLVTYVYGQGKSCPLASKVTSCSPKCKDDTECFGKRCCNNICNTKSCVAENIRGGDDDYKGSKNTATGSYCGNVKCSAFEKCQIDRTTNRQKCVRS
ncbi:waprin-like protein [Onthophagus taurus]|uniref:waprin-like protein n=1 Tax=Onthophagus taurus TaxID=166361 RepID=UPI0039BE283C